MVVGTALVAFTILSSSKIISKKTVEKCRQMHGRILKMLNQVSVGQLKTNLDRIYMEPGIWWVFALHMHRPSLLNNPSHPMCYVELKAHAVWYYIVQAQLTRLHVLWLAHNKRIRSYIKSLTFPLNYILQGKYSIGVESFSVVLILAH
jgi:hypothetical protein